MCALPSRPCHISTWVSSGAVGTRGDTIRAAPRSAKCQSPGRCLSGQAEIKQNWQGEEVGWLKINILYEPASRDVFLSLETSFGASAAGSGAVSISVRQGRARRGWQMLFLKQPRQHCFACYCENLCLVSANTRGEIFARHKLTAFPQKCLCGVGRSGRTLAPHRNSSAFMGQQKIIQRAQINSLLAFVAELGLPKEENRVLAHAG